MSKVEEDKCFSFLFLGWAVDMKRFNILGV